MKFTSSVMYLDCFFSMSTFVVSVSDDPKLVSSRHKDIFEDILEDRRHSSDLRYSMRTRDVPKFRLNKARTPQQIKDHVLKSDRVQYAIEQVSNFY